MSSDRQSVLQAACDAMADGCCQVFNADGTCCMSESVKEMFTLIEAAGGPSLAQCEAIVDGKMKIVEA